MNVSTGRTRTLVTSLSLSALLSALCGCTEEKTDKPDAIVRPVVTSTVAPPETKFLARFAGVSRGEKETQLSFRVTGRLTELFVKVGERVTVGHVVGRLDNTDAQLEVKRAEADAGRARADLEKAKQDRNRTQQLFEASSASRAELDQVEARFKSAVAADAVAGRQVDLAKQQLKYYTLDAALAGRIAAVPVEVGQNVTAGQTIATVTAGDRMKVVVGVPEDLIARVKVDQRADVRFDARTDAFKARVTEVGVEATDATTYPITLLLEEADEALRSGMVCEVTFSYDLPADQRVHYVPPPAVVSTPSGAFIWVVDGGMVSKRSIDVGALAKQGLAVKSGVTQGDVVVIRGVHRLQQGQRVRLLDAKPKRDEQ